jgi:hypothetical protein
MANKLLYRHKIDDNHYIDVTSVYKKLSRYSAGKYEVFLGDVKFFNYCYGHRRIGFIEKFYEIECDIKGIMDQFDDEFNFDKTLNGIEEKAIQLSKHIIGKIIK